MRHRLAVLVYQLERSADLGLAHALGRFGYPLPPHALLLVLEVPYQASARDDEEKA